MSVTEAHRVLVVAVRFPSPIQPWLLNQIGQIYRHGGSVRIVARGPEGTTYPPLVDELDLLSRTSYLPAATPVDLLRGAGRLLAPGGGGARARAGLRRMLAAGWRPEGVKGCLKAVARASAVEISDVDLMHAHSLRYAYEFLHVAEVRDLPVVVTFHGHTTRGVGLLSEPKRERLFSALDLALVNTSFARSQLEAIGCPSDRIEILPQGIPLADYPYRPRSRPDDGPVRLLSVGRLQGDKGFAYAIDAAALLLERGYDIDYTIVGGGPEENALRERIDRTGHADRIRLAGRVDDATLRDLYGEAHVFILPSVADRSDDHTETQGVVIQEAQASGVLVAASRVGGIPECVDDGESAFLFPDRDPEAIAGVVGRLLDRPEAWRGWQDAARTWVERRFDIDELGAKLMGLYAMIRAKRRAESRARAP